MNTTQNYLTRLKAMHGGASDYRAAQILGITQQSVSQYKMGKCQLSDETATKMASELGLDPLKVVAEVKLETSKSRETRQLWARVLDMTNAAPALALLGLAALLPYATDTLTLI